ncbi:hypothetical protein ACOJQI_12265 [Bacillus salacetis]|uniref:hypothetical protein n=1 Tax=Bacillus salacetis TaxID=2315464 RepID=UPI003BA3267C
MFGFVSRDKLVKDDLRGIAQLMYQDVSKDEWDQENLTKANLDFSLESVRVIDRYAKKRLMNAEYDSDLLHNHFDNFVNRLGAYIGEVVRRQISQDYNWYEAVSVYKYSDNVDKESLDKKFPAVLYSKKKDKVISPLKVVSEFLRGSSPYPNLLRYAEEMIKGHS